MQQSSYLKSNLSCDDFINNATLVALLVAFANTKPCDIGFVIESSYKSSKYSPVELTEIIYQENNQLLCDFTGLLFQLNKTKHQFFIQTDLPSDEFFNQIYKYIQIKRIEHQISDHDFSNLILLSFFGLRGSPDFKLNFYSLDLPRQIVSFQYLDHLFKLLTNISDLRQLNLNFRELQYQFIVGENERNTQFRINLRYFYDNLAKDLLKVNKFKANILLHNNELIITKNIARESKTFIERLMFYKDKVLNQQNTEREIEQLRKVLGFVYDEMIDERVKRNQGIVQYVRAFFDDECACCKNIYPLESRTFKYRHSERFYLEIHHVISFSVDHTLDQIDNLVKLCPACHRALTKNRADETYQKQLISAILVNAPKAKEFCLNFTDENNCIQFIYDRLR
ncbi:HNH endonuclease [Moraxella cuniculi]|uniref:HNH domain-containing protein n=1 Tax=Moraxella cuniculi TaxID=34061 RepID=A0A3S4T0E6_9GAMM|nr:HNH endonuclease [Moraxella cuniculi]VEG13915.1 Uncharacterised protein [Moraxella cuniculi]